MHSKIAIALLAALPLSVAHAVAAPNYKEIQVRQITSVPGAAVTSGNPSAAMPTTNIDDLTQCFLPTSLIMSIPTDVPTPPAALESALTTLTDPCATLAIPGSLSAAYLSYSSAVVSWAKANEPALSSQAAAISSFEASLSSNPVCASLLPSTSAYTASATGFGVCTAVTTGHGSTATGSSGNSSSKSSASNNPATSRETTILLFGTFLAGCLVAVVAL